MSEQQPTDTTSSTGSSGMDRRRFLLRTTAVTAGAWAAPSILTIDRAFGATGGSPEPCVNCGPNTSTDAATVKGFAIPLGMAPILVRQNACLNDDSPSIEVPLPLSLGTVQAGAVTCGECEADVNVVSATIGPIVTRELQATSTCSCTGGPTGSSEVAFLQIGDDVLVNLNTTETVTFPIPAAFGSGFVTLNEVGTGADAGEFNAVHIVYTDLTGNVIDLKLASAKATCA